jgi:hypothetical protein
MDTSNTLSIIAYVLQFTLMSTWIFITNKRIERIESAKCRCCSRSHPLLDSIDPIDP